MEVGTVNETTTKKRGPGRPKKSTTSTLITPLVTEGRSTRSGLDISTVKKRRTNRINPPNINSITTPQKPRIDKENLRTSPANEIKIFSGQEDEMQEPPCRYWSSEFARVETILNDNNKVRLEHFSWYFEQAENGGADLDISRYNCTTTKQMYLKTREIYKPTAIGPKTITSGT